MELEKLKIAVENRAKTLGITEYEVFCKSNLETTVETLNKEISSFSSSLTGGACVRVIRDGKMGYASGELITEESVAELVSIAATPPSSAAIFLATRSLVGLARRV